ncbi:MAG: hypothetical protein ACREM3_19355 [Candidatus Rokuibacteriota bacterium]
MSSFRLVITAVALFAVVIAGAASAEAQVFFASRPSPQLTVTPLFVVAGVAPGVADVPVEVVFSLGIPPTRSALDFEQDLYLLWPGAVVAAGAPKADFALPPAVAAHVEVVDEGRLRVFAQRHYETAGDLEEIQPGAAFVTVVRAGGPLGLTPPATYIRIPWTPKIANQAWLVSVHLTARGLVKPKATTWLGRMVSGPRSLLALGFDDVSAPAMFSMYYWQRDRVLPVASPARLVVNFAGADRLAIDTLFPPAARRELSPSLETTEAVSLFLAPAEGVTPQVLRVEFGYFSRLQSWGPILVPALFFALGNVAAVLLRTFVERLRQRLAGRVQVGRRRATAARVDDGVVIPREQLAAIVPMETTYEEVLRRCGPEVEEREDLATPRRKVLVYRGRRDVPHRRWTWGWLATVSYWDVERHEVEITLEDGVVQDIQLRVGRTRHAQP